MHQQTGAARVDLDRVRGERSYRSHLLTASSPLSPHSFPLRSHSVNLGFELCKTDLLEYTLLRRALGEAETRGYVRQLVSAVAHLHACNVVHLDIKLENIFLDSHNQLKLGDLGLASVALPGTLTRKTCGSGVYAAPEVLCSKSFGAYDGRAADIWALGVCTFVLIRGRFPFHTKQQTVGYTEYLEATHVADKAGEPPPIPPPVLSGPAQREPFSPTLLDMLDACINYEPANRPAANELPFFSWMEEDEKKKKADVEEEQEKEHNAEGVPMGIPVDEATEKEVKLEAEEEPLPETVEEAPTERTAEAHSPANSPIHAPRRMDTPSNKRAAPPSCDFDAVEEMIMGSKVPGKLRRPKANERSAPYQRSRRSVKLPAVV